MTIVYILIFGQRNSTFLLLNSAATLSLGYILSPSASLPGEDRFESRQKIRHKLKHWKYVPNPMINVKINIKSMLQYPKRGSTNTRKKE